MTVSSSTNKVSYSGNGSLTTFAYTFKIFDQSDLVVILRAADGTETVQTITTHYTVSGVGSASGGNVVFGSAPASGVTVVILRSQPLTQGLDLVANDPFPAESLEEALDKLVFMTQKHEEELSRAIKGSRTNVIANSEFTVSATDRANKLFSFDAAGNLSIAQELGTFRGDWATGTAYNPRDIVKDTSTNNIFLVNTAHTSSGSQPLTTNANSAKYDLIVDAATATTAQTASAASAAAAANDAADAEKLAINAEDSQFTLSDGSTTGFSALHHKEKALDAQTAAETAKTAAETALDSFDDRYLGAKSTSGGLPTVDNDGDALIDGALFFDTTNNVLMVYNLGTTTWLRTTPTGSDQTSINTVNANATNINTVAGQISPTNNISTVAGISSSITTVAGDTTNIGTIATNLGGSNTIGTVAGLSSQITTLGAISSAISTAASISSDISDVANIESNISAIAQSAATTNINTVAADISGSNNIGAVAGAISNVNTVGGAISNVNTVATNLTAINTVNTNISAITTVNSNSSDITAVAGAVSNVNTVANNLTSVNAFGTQYQVSQNAPSNPTEGLLWFDTDNDVMKVYNSTSSVFQNAGSSVNGTTNRVNYVVGTSSGSYNGSTTVFPATYDAGFLDVYLNGVRLDPADFTATNGTSVTLGSAATSGDTVGIVGYGTFVLSDHYSKTQSDARYAQLSGATFTGAIDMGSNNITTTGKILYSNLYSATSDLPSASTYHGMFAHVHATGAGYFAHGGNWLKLVNEDTSGNVVISGNLTVSGTTTTVNSTTLDVADKNITIANGAADAATANGAGLTVDGASATFNYASSGDKWTMNKPLDVTGTANATALSIGGTAITSTATELNLLDGVTATTAELNYVDGVTSAIQTQLDAKAPTASPTFTTKATIDGTLDIEEVYEKVTVQTSTTGTITFDTTAQAVEFYTANQTANRTINFSNVNANLAVGQSLTVAIAMTQGSTAYYLNAYQVDGSSVTPKWQGGSAPTAGNANSIDSYSFTIIKTADATFTVLASVTQFA